MAIAPPSPNRGGPLGKPVPLPIAPLPRGGLSRPLLFQRMFLCSLLCLSYGPAARLFIWPLLRRIGPVPPSSLPTDVLQLGGMPFCAMNAAIWVRFGGMLLLVNIEDRPGTCMFARLKPRG